jgi:hypothetical protein
METARQAEVAGVIAVADSRHASWGGFAFAVRDRQQSLLAWQSGRAVAESVSAKPLEIACDGLTPAMRRPIGPQNPPELIRDEITRPRR